jgi:phage gpG-like protein
MANQFNFNRVRQNMRNIDLSLVMANTAKNGFLDNFTSQSFDGVAWKKRTGKQDGRNLLVKSGRLRRDVSNSVSRGIKNSNLSYTLLVANPYAEVHNTGGVIQKKARTGNVNFKVNSRTGRSRFARESRANFQQTVNFKAYNIQMPKRQFVGMTNKLNTKILLAIHHKLKSIWNN